MNHLLSGPLGEYLIAGIIMALTVLAATIFSKLFGRFIRKTAKELINDPTKYQFLRYALTAVIYLVGFGLAIYTIPPLRTLASSMLAGAGILAVVVGFASQSALSNVVAGAFIVIFKPFRLNDRITIKDTLSGVVEDITLRHTVIRNFENRRIIVPNSIISNEILINADLVESKVCKWLHLDISYDSDIDLARKIIQEEVAAHPNLIDNRKPEEIESGKPLVPVRVIALADFSVKLRAWAWAEDNPKAFELETDLLESIKKRFDREGIEIPFPYRTIVFKAPFDPPTSA